MSRGAPAIQILGHGGNLLHIAAFFGLPVRDIRDSVAAGDDVNARDASGLTPVEVALKYGLDAPRIIKELRAVGADMALPDHEGNTLLHRQIIAQDLEGITFSLQNGAEPNAFNFIIRPELARYSEMPESLAVKMLRPPTVWGDTDQAGLDS